MVLFERYIVVKFDLDVYNSLGQKLVSVASLPAANITGQVATANGGTGQNLSASTGDLVVDAGVVSANTRTGTGDSVRASSPTIVTPTIASFANANHDHTNSAGGGTLSWVGEHVVIARTVLGSAAASHTTSAFATTFKHLKVLIEARTDVAALFDSIILQPNSDSTAANYYTESVYYGAAAVITQTNATVAGILLDNAAVGASAPSNVTSGIEVTIYNYASTSKQREIQYNGGGRAGTTGQMRTCVGSGFWLNTANAISTLKFLPSAGTNLHADFAYTIYGFN